MINNQQAREFIQKYFDFNELKKLINDCKYEDSTLTEEGCYICTLISGSAGIYIIKEFFNLISDVLDIDLNIQNYDELNDDYITEFYNCLDKINDELEEVFKEQGIDTVNFNYLIDFNEFDGALDLFMVLNKSNANCIYENKEGVI